VLWLYFLDFGAALYLTSSASTWIDYVHFLCCIEFIKNWFVLLSAWKKPVLTCLLSNGLIHCTVTQQSGKKARMPFFIFSRQDGLLISALSILCSNTNTSANVKKAKEKMGKKKKKRLKQIHLPKCVTH